MSNVPLFFSGSNILKHSRAYSEPNVICSYPWSVFSPGVIIVCLFEFPFVTLIGCLNFVLMSVAYVKLSISDCVYEVCAQFVHSLCLVKYTFLIGKIILEKSFT